MKLLSLLFLISTASRAAINLTLEIPLGHETEKVTVEQTDKNEWFITKTTNSLNITDRRLGTFKLIDGNNLKTLQGHLKQVQSDIHETQLLLETGKKTNAPAPQAEANTAHAPYLSFNGRRFLHTTPFYAELLKLVREFSKLPGELQTGVALDEKKENLEKWINGKKVSTETFSTAVYCQGSAPHQRCKARGWGTFYLQ